MGEITRIITLQITGIFKENLDQVCSKEVAEKKIRDFVQNQLRPMPDDVLVTVQDFINEEGGSNG